MEEFSFKKKHIFLIFGAFLIFLYLSDQFKRPDFKISVNEMLGSNNGTHSVTSWIDTSTNQLAGLVSFSSMAILNYVPVRTLSQFFCLQLFTKN